MTASVDVGFDPAPLDEFLRATLPGATGKFGMTPTSGGLSNPTFFVDYDDLSVVLRKQPAGVLAASAHAIDREYRVMSALQGTNVPVPKMILYHEDRSLIGTPFYVMQRVDGFVSTQAALPGISSVRRHSLYLAMARTIAAVHTVDWQGIGLEDYGKPSGYAERQLRRWSRFWREHGLGGNPDLDAVVAWLESNLPCDDTVSLNHGDLRIANLMFAHQDDEIVALLDWELSTIGDPRADVAYCLLAYQMRPEENGGLRGLDLAALGIPSEAAFLACYYEEVGVGRRLQTFDIVLALFRAAAGSESVASRAVRSATHNAAAAVFGRRMGKAYAGRALEIIAAGGI